MKPRGRHRRDACSGVSPARTHNKPTRTRTSQVSPARRPFSLHRGAAGRKRSRRPPSLPLRAGRRRVETTSPSTRRPQRSLSIAVNACRNADINECLHQIGFGAAMRRALREFGLDDFVREKAVSGAQRRPRGQAPGISLTNNALAPAERQGPPAKVALALYVAIRVGPFGQGSSRRGQTIVSRSAARRTQLSPAFGRPVHEMPSVLQAASLVAGQAL